MHLNFNFQYLEKKKKICLAAKSRGGSNRQLGITDFFAFCRLRPAVDDQKLRRHFLTKNSTGGPKEKCPHENFRWSPLKILLSKKHTL